MINNKAGKRHYWIKMFQYTQYIPIYLWGKEMGDLYDLKHIVFLTQRNFEFVTYRSHIKAI